MKLPDRRCEICCKWYIGAHACISRADYSEPLSNLPAILSRLTVELNDRRYPEALARAG